MRFGAKAMSMEARNFWNKQKVLNSCQRPIECPVDDALEFGGLQDRGALFSSRANGKPQNLPKKEEDRVTLIAGSSQQYLLRPTIADNARDSWANADLSTFD